MLRDKRDGVGSGERIGDIPIAPCITVAIIILILIFM